MRKIAYNLFVILNFVSCAMIFGVTDNNQIQMTIKNQSQEKMKLLLAVLSPTPELITIAEFVRSDLSCSQQKLSGFNVEMRHLTDILSKKKMKSFFGEGFSVVIVLSVTKEGKIEWRLYDSLQATMQQGKRIALLKSLESTAHTVADQLWKILTGQDSIFLTKIAYCKVVKKDKQLLKNIYIQSPMQYNSHCFVTGGKLLAPRWNKDLSNPLILYSEVTQANIRLMSATLDGKRKIISNFDGLTMLANFSLDGQKVVYCASYKGNCQLYYYYYDQAAKKGITKRLTNNKSNNTSPNLCENGDIIFCSDFETKSPQLYCLTPTTGDIKKLTQGGYCASPHYSDKNKTVAYSKLIGNEMQIFLYNVATQEHKQITFDKGNKDESSWSPCGNYLAFVLKEGKKSRISLLNMLTHERFFLTSEHEACSYPAWSLRYSDVGIFA